MIKVSVLYPAKPDARFDHDYYRDSHMPLVKRSMGDTCLFYTIDKGVAGGEPGSPPPFVAMCHIYCDTLDAFNAGFAPHADEIFADVPRYTNITPTMVISDVVVGQP
jgi:uncharacterized protein (TIGR02118 family)